MKNDYFGNGHTYDKLLSLLGATEEEVEDEIKWVSETLLDYYNETETPKLCHNDLHLGNMMIDEDDSTGDSLILIDFDNTRYGYRVFDLIYFLNYQAVSLDPSAIGEEYGSQFYPSDETIMDFVTIYTESFNANYNKTTSEGTTVEKMMEEVYAHTPYNLLEQIMFLWGAVGLESGSLRCEYERYAERYGRQSAIKCPYESDTESDSLYIFVSSFLLLSMTI